MDEYVKFDYLGLLSTVSNYKIIHVSLALTITIALIISNMCTKIDDHILLSSVFA